MTSHAAINHHQNIPEVYRAFVEAHNRLLETDIDAGLHHLVKLLASQINRCAFCVNMHVEEALKDGESHKRLERLTVWRHSGDFSAAEKAAFAWTEALTVLDDSKDLGILRDELRKHYSDVQISAITAVVAMINMWNRLGVSNH
ncbi:carboxymuconolactone decarboxylase family protein [Roseibium suaedae]|uniref:Alkylhydroperoxidase AhpD family core domain-containing protein n=1 Tax=Roseibium suaedae TaxID=735517 RepID=A0A1M7MAK5_9HYPH|nr:carboxymuconolactone decarboxylase family protein [Roseibium suaedae]SHM87344.1 alkylhydroperoxidase AhpD family core domain-containing protein [Roseibium suaedae]